MSNIGKMATPGEKKYMSIAEFEQLISQADIFSENLNSSQVTLCYNLAMQSRVDEINEDRHLNMEFTEFIEALARVAD